MTGDSEEVVVCSGKDTPLHLGVLLPEGVGASLGCQADASRMAKDQGSRCDVPLRKGGAEDDVEIPLLHTVDQGGHVRLREEFLPIGGAPRLPELLLDLSEDTAPRFRG